MRLLHSLAKTHASFDDPNLVSHAGLVPVMALADRAGLGDLVLTCTGDLSRNRMVGLELAKGRRLAEIVGSMKMVAEGVETCAAAVALAERHHVDLPIIQQMRAVLYASKSPAQAIRDLMERTLKGE